MLFLERQFALNSDTEFSAGASLHVVLNAWNQQPVSVESASAIAPVDRPTPDGRDESQKANSLRLMIALPVIALCVGIIATAGIAWAVWPSPPQPNTPGTAAASPHASAHNDSSDTQSQHAGSANSSETDLDPVDEPPMRPVDASDPESVTLTKEQYDLLRSTAKTVESSPTSLSAPPLYGTGFVVARHYQPVTGHVVVKLLNVKRLKLGADVTLTLSSVGDAKSTRRIELKKSKSENVWVAEEEDLDQATKDLILTSRSGTLATVNGDRATLSANLPSFRFGNVDEVAGLSPGHVEYKSMLGPNNVVFHSIHASYIVRKSAFPRGVERLVFELKPWKDGTASESGTRLESTTTCEVASASFYSVKVTIALMPWDPSGLILLKSTVPEPKQSSSSTPLPKVDSERVRNEPSSSKATPATGKGGAAPSSNEPFKPTRYAGAESGHWIRKNVGSGRYLVLEDNSFWKIDTLDRIDAMLWMLLEKVTVVGPDDLSSYTITNTDDKESVTATHLGKLDKSTIASISDNGSVLILGDRRVWKIGAADRLTSKFWNKFDDVAVVKDKFGTKLVNMSNGEGVRATKPE